MYRLLLVLIVGLLISPQLHGQGKTYIGVKAGVTASTVSFFHSFDGDQILTKYENGFQAGVVMMNYLKRHVGFQAELNYVQKGWIQRFDNDIPDFSTNLDYIELPILATIHTGKESLHLFFNAGCFAEYLVNVSQSEKPDDINDEFFIPFDESRDNKFGYGFKGGLGAFKDFNFGTIMLETNVSYGLSNIMNEGSLNSKIPNFSNPWTFGVTLAYLFSFGEFN